MKRVVNLNEWLENRNDVVANEISNSADEALINEEKTASEKLADEVSGELYKATLRGNSATVTAITTTQMWDDGVPVLKYLARGKGKPVKMEKKVFDVVHDVAHGWFYFSDGRKWFGLHVSDGYADPSDLPFDVKIAESVETEVNERMPEPRKDEYYFLVRNSDAKDVWKMADYEFGNDIDRGRIEVLFQKNKYVIKDFELAKRFYQYLRDRGVKFFDQNFVSESVEVNEARSLNKIQKDFTAVTSEMAEVVLNWKAAKESGDAKAEANFLARLKDLTAKKKGLEKEMDEFVMGKDRDAELAGVLEALLTEAKFKVGQVWLWKNVDGDKEVEVVNVKPNGDVVGRIKGTSQDFIVRDANKYLKKKISESIVNEAKVDLAQLTDILANLEDAFTEEEFIEVGQDVNVDAKTMEDIWNGYWEVDAKNRLHWGDKEWAKWLKANYGVK